MGSSLRRPSSGEVVPESHTVLTSAQTVTANASTPEGGGLAVAVPAGLYDANTPRLVIPPSKLPPAVIAGLDADIDPSNIKSGVVIGNVTGTLVVESHTVDSANKTGTISKNGNALEVTIPSGLHDGTTKISDATAAANITPANIKTGVTILGVEGASAPIPTPVQSAISSIGTTGFTVSWEAVSNAITYLLTVSPNSDFSSPVSGYNALDVGDVLTKDVTGLDSHTTYYAKVVATIPSAASNSQNAKTRLPAPVAADATNVGDGVFRANWAAATGATGYRLDVSPDGFSTFVTGFEDKDVGDVTYYDMSSLTNGTTYSYRVRAAAGSDRSESSNSKTATLVTVPTVSITNASNSNYNGSYPLVSDGNVEGHPAYVSTAVSGRYIRLYVWEGNKYLCILTDRPGPGGPNYIAYSKSDVTTINGSYPNNTGWGGTATISVAGG